MSYLSTCTSPHVFIYLFFRGCARPGKAVCKCPSFSFRHTAKAHAMTLHPTIQSTGSTLNLDIPGPSLGNKTDEESSATQRASIGIQASTLVSYVPPAASGACDQSIIFLHTMLQSRWRVSVETSNHRMAHLKLFSFLYFV